MTTEPSEKCSGVGYSPGLENFRTQLTADLLDAITKNYQKLPEIKTETTVLAENDEEPVIDSPINTIQVHNLQSSFIENECQIFSGHQELIQQILNFCLFDSSKSKVHVLSGDFGSGKTAMTATIANKCLDISKTTNHLAAQMGDYKSPGNSKDGSSEKITNIKNFVFVHLVYVSPQSTCIETALRRCLDQLLNTLPAKFHDTFTKINEYCCKNSQPISSKFLDFVYEVAEHFPERTFTFIFDDVSKFKFNDYTESLKWIPDSQTNEVIKNVKVLLSVSSSSNSCYKRVHQ